MNKENSYTAIIEAILFASGDPLHIAKLAGLTSLNRAAVRHQLEVLNEKYSDSDSGIQLLRLDEYYQLCTKPEFAGYAKEAVGVTREIPLSSAAMEVIAIIAYNQPVTKGFIEEVRGVNSAHIVNTLVEKGLIEEAGRLDMPGRPITYKTTTGFLRSFGLESLDELPPLPENEDQINFEDLQGTENE
ncbi:MAG: SMC-Scp complex subunit ScpB [Oscillospiraceae bacterium]|nr:SMC-Scp complex subunit ScpB [Oscillospiraceae bacterium]